jgi:hypothetical protein
MDTDRFDALARSLTSAASSRRRVLTVLGAALSGGSLLSALPGEAVALSR